MTTTVGDIIRASMRLINVLGAGEPLPEDDGGDAREAFERMVDAWSLEDLMIPIVSVVTKELVQGMDTYTIGYYPTPKPVPLPVNHIEAARPMEIVSIYLRDGSGTDYPISFMYAKSYAQISRKTDSARPCRIYVRQGWPMDELIFNAPLYDTETLHLEVRNPFTELLPALSLDESIDLPPGYRQALVYNLAVHLGDEWEKSVKMSVAGIAASSKKLIKRNNYKPTMLRVDRGLMTGRGARGTYEIESGV